MAKPKYEYWLTQEGLCLVAGWARDGLTDEQIARNMGVSRKTLCEWKGKYSGIGDALKKGKEVIDYAIENALVKKALSGDVTAMIFWLKNRRPDKWRDKPDGVKESGESTLKVLAELAVILRNPVPNRELPKAEEEGET